jgi:CheY-like chemotaxis protein
VDVVRDGLTAPDALTNGSYDILITDRVMPRMDGLDLVTGRAGAAGGRGRRRSMRWPPPTRGQTRV